MRSIDNNLLARYVVTVVTPFAEEAVNIGEKGGSWSSVLYQKVLIIPPTSLINTNTKHFNLSIFLNASYVQTNHGPLNLPVDYFASTPTCLHQAPEK